MTMEESLLSTEIAAVGTCFTQLTNISLTFLLFFSFVLHNGTTFHSFVRVLYSGPCVFSVSFAADFFLFFSKKFFCWYVCVLEKICALQCVFDLILWCELRFFPGR
jgi:hypothetical protein